MRRNRAVSAATYITCDALYAGSVACVALRHADAACDVAFYVLATLAAAMLTVMNLLSCREAERRLDQAEEEIRQLEEEGK